MNYYKIMPIISEFYQRKRGINMFSTVSMKKLSVEEFRKLKENDIIFYKMNGHTFQTTVISKPIETENSLFVDTRSGVFIHCGNAYVDCE